MWVLSNRNRKKMAKSLGTETPALRPLGEAAASPLSASCGSPIPTLLLDRQQALFVFPGQRRWLPASFWASSPSLLRQRLTRVPQAQHVQETLLLVHVGSDVHRSPTQTGTKPCSPRFLLSSHMSQGQHTCDCEWQKPSGQLWAQRKNCRGDDWASLGSKTGKAAAPQICSEWLTHSWGGLCSHTICGLALSENTASLVQQLWRI